MSSPRITYEDSYFSWSDTIRNYTRSQNGVYGDKKSVYPYTFYLTKSFGAQINKLNGTRMAIDAPNTRSLYDLQSYLGVPPWARPSYNKCYARFRESVNGEAEALLGATIATWRESFIMIHKRLLSLVGAAKALRSGNFRAFLRALRVPAKSKHKNKIRALPDEFSSLWLEYWFGWSPLIADIYAAVNVVQGPLPNGTARARAKAHVTWLGYPYPEKEMTTWTEVRHQILADVILENPNLWLANQLGLANPVLVTWDLIPFSFVADWFFDVSGFLGSFTDFVGLRINNPCVTHTGEWYDTILLKVSHLEGGPQTCIGIYMRRHSTLLRPLPNTQLITNLGSSITRAASAASLLTKLLVGNPKGKTS